MDSVRQAYRADMEKLTRNEAVESWYSQLLSWPMADESYLVAEFPFDESTTSDAVSSLFGRGQNVAPGGAESNSLSVVRDEKHSAVLFDGKNAIVFPKLAGFPWTQEFSICLELKLNRIRERAVVLHRSNVTDERATQGFEVVIEQGHLIFALMSKASRSEVRIKSKRKVPVGEWMHIAFVYGSTKSVSDVEIYINGQRCEVELVSKSLESDFLDPGGDDALYLGAWGKKRRESEGLEGGLVDQLQVYNVALTPIEVAACVDSKFLTWSELTPAQKSIWREHYARRVDTQCRYHLESLQHYFSSLSVAIQTDH